MTRDDDLSYEEMRAARRAQQAVDCDMWRARVNTALQMHLGLLDEELCEITARFLVRETWLVRDLQITNKHLILFARALGH